MTMRQAGRTLWPASRVLSRRLYRRGLLVHLPRPRSRTQLERSVACSVKLHRGRAVQLAPAS